MVSSEMIKNLLADQDLIDLAIEDRKQGNYYGASCLINRYEQLITEEMNFWHVDWAYIYSLGLIVDTTQLY